MLVALSLDVPVVLHQTRPAGEAVLTRDNALCIAELELGYRLFDDAALLRLRALQCLIVAAAQLSQQGLGRFAFELNAGPRR